MKRGLKESSLQSHRASGPDSLNEKRIERSKAWTPSMAGFGASMKRGLKGSCGYPSGSEIPGEPQWKEDWKIQWHFSELLWIHFCLNEKRIERFILSFALPRKSWRLNEKRIERWPRKTSRSGRRASLNEKRIESGIFLGGISMRDPEPQWKEDWKLMSWHCRRCLSTRASMKRGLKVELPWADPFILPFRLNEKRIESLLPWFLH